MAGQPVNSGRKNGDLHFGRTGVVIAAFELLYQFRFPLSGNRHQLPRLLGFSRLSMLLPKHVPSTVSNKTLIKKLTCANVQTANCNNCRLPLQRGGVHPLSFSALSPLQEGSVCGGRDSKNRHIPAMQTLVEPVLSSIPVPKLQPANLAESSANGRSQAGVWEREG